MYEFYGGAGIAFAVAALVVYFDCYQALRKTQWRAPSQYYLDAGVLLLCAACGVLAAVAFWWAGGPGASAAEKSWLETLLGGRVENAYVRGFYTGGAVLALVRSKVCEFRNSDIGLELFYGEGRVRALSNVRIAARNWRDDKVARNMQPAMALPDFDDRMIGLVRAAIQDADEQTRSNIEAQITEVRAAKPATAVSPTDPAWRTYYRTISNLALENCGEAAFRGLPGFT